MERGNRKVRTGTVVSDRMEKTVLVSVERTTRHPLYGRRIKRTKRFMAHNENNIARLGDTVRIEETRPLSKQKRWRVSAVVHRHEGPVVLTAETVDLPIDPEATAEA